MNEYKKILKEKLTRKQELELKIKKIENDIYKYETLLLEISDGNPISRSLENYLTQRTEKKKTNIKDNDRLFTINMPRVSRK
ncbi:Nua4 family protein putative Histone H4 acetyltransferase [Spraguea lophii 42_110]|uniref:Chromatin modification-related protein EAF6 n=1 Tax=Spraguea lophii (strain 42_110) TaxID=1358809 RepID=S7WC63_SPRLO|nr:Nua4 family protein putative Histone H4 acetyltransferase [Spraguea lophii 42_110]